MPFKSGQGSHTAPLIDIGGVYAAENQRRLRDVAEHIIAERDVLKSTLSEIKEQVASAIAVTKTFNLKKAQSITAVWSAAKNLNGATPFISVSTGTTISVAAAKTMRTQGLHTISGSVITDSSSKKLLPIYDLFANELTFIGDKPFTVVPFVSIQEVGEVITNTDGTGYNFATNVEATLGAKEFTLAYGPVVGSKMVDVGGNARYKARLVIDLRPWANRYSLRYSELEQEAMTAYAPVLSIGLVAIAPATTTITYDSIYAYVYHTIPRDF